MIEFVVDRCFRFRGGALGSLVLLAPVWLSTGCLGFQFSIEKTRTQIGLTASGTCSGLTEGRSGYREALKCLGAPSDIAQVDDGFVFYYFSSDFDEFRLTLSFRGQARFSYAAGSQDTHFLVLAFGDDGLLIARRSVAGRQGRGYGITFGHAQTKGKFFGARNYETRGSSRNRWGSRWLRHDDLKLDSTPGGHFWKDGRAGSR